MDQLFDGLVDCLIEQDLDVGVEDLALARILLGHRVDDVQKLLAGLATNLDKTLVIGSGLLSAHCRTLDIRLEWHVKECRTRRNSVGYANTYEIQFRQPLPSQWLPHEEYSKGLEHLGQVVNL